MLVLEAIPNTCWTPVRVRARCEKTVARFCESLAIAHYLPLLRRRARYQRRMVETFIPMFTGYLFVQLGQDDAERLVQCGKIAVIFRMDEALERQLLGELRSLQLVEQANLQTEVTVAPELVPGTPVEVVAGPFQGMVGIIEKRDKTARVSINVELLGQSASVVLDIGELAEWNA